MSPPKYMNKINFAVLPGGQMTSWGTLLAHKVPHPGPTCIPPVPTDQQIEMRHEVYFREVDGLVELSIDYERTWHTCALHLEELQEMWGQSLVRLRLKDDGSA